MSTIDKLKRGGVIKPLPYTTYHVSEIDKALMTFGKGTHVGKIVLSYDHESEPGINVYFLTNKGPFASLATDMHPVPSQPFHSDFRPRS